MGEWADQAVETLTFSSRSLGRARRLPLKVCRHCGQRNLIWRMAATGWRLHTPNGGALHVCLPATPDAGVSLLGDKASPATDDRNPTLRERGE